MTAGAFSTAALVGNYQNPSRFDSYNTDYKALAAFFIVDRKADFNGHVDAPVEAEAPILDYSEKA